jgi:hypothetical protein
MATGVSPLSPVVVGSSAGSRVGHCDCTVEPGRGIPLGNPSPVGLAGKSKDNRSWGRAGFDPSRPDPSTSRSRQDVGTALVRGAAWVPAEETAEHPRLV